MGMAEPGRGRQDDARPDREAAGAGAVQDDAMAAEVLAVAHTLAAELQPQLGRTLAVRADSALDRDLGLDSLGRAELLLRLGRRFGVRLPETLLGQARTVGDLLAAVRAASPGPVGLA